MPHDTGNGRDIAYEQSRDKPGGLTLFCGPFLLLTIHYAATFPSGDFSLFSRDFAECEIVPAAVQQEITERLRASATAPALNFSVLLDLRQISLIRGRALH